MRLRRSWSPESLQRVSSTTVRMSQHKYLKEVVSIDPSGQAAPHALMWWSSLTSTAYNSAAVVVRVQQRASRPDPTASCRHYLDRQTEASLTQVEPLSRSCRTTSEQSPPVQRQPHHHDLPSLVSATGGTGSRHHSEALHPVRAAPQGLPQCSALSAASRTPPCLLRPSSS